MKENGVPSLALIVHRSYCYNSNWIGVGEEGGLIESPRKNGIQRWNSSVLTKFLVLLWLYQEQ